MFINSSQLNRFKNNWVEQFPEAERLMLSFNYHTRCFVANFYGCYTDELRNQLILDLEKEGNYGFLHVRNTYEDIAFGELGRKVNDMIHTFNGVKWEDDTLKLVRNHPYEESLTFNILWSEHPVIELLVHDDYHAEDVVIASMANEKEVEQIKNEFLEECQHIEAQFQKIKLFLAPYIAQGKVTVENEEEKSYIIGNRHTHLRLNKRYYDDCIEYVSSMFMFEYTHEHLEEMYDWVQKEVPMLIALDGVKAEILDTIWKMDPYAFRYRWDELIINHRKHEFTLDVYDACEENKEYTFTYRLLSNQKRTFSSLEELKTFAITEIRKELGNLRLKSIFNDNNNKGHFTRIEKMYDASIITIDDPNIIQKELETYFGSSKDCPYKRSVDQDQLGNVFVLRERKMVYLALSKENMEEYFQTQQQKGAGLCF